MIDVTCQTCSHRMQAPESHAGQTSACPRCGTIVLIPCEQNSVPEREQTRKLPWFIDIILYPISISGAIHLVIFAFLPSLFLSACRFDFWSRYYSSSQIFWVAVLIIGMAYFFYYLAVCVRDSAAGGLRAPDINTQWAQFDAEDLLAQLLYTFFCGVLCFGPAAIYFILTQKTNIPFWVLSSMGIFIFPMLFLAIALFGSVRALSPILVFGSIFDLLLPYCGLLIFLCLIALLVARITFLARFTGVIQIYLLLVMAHSLGRFYWRYKEKLNWEV